LTVDVDLSNALDTDNYSIRLEDGTSGDGGMLFFGARFW
jgi:hypothetical protein